MAIAVASKTALGTTNYPDSTIVLTAPTGIASGDLLVIIAGGYANGTPSGGALENYSANSGVVTCPGFTEGYFHSYDVNRNSSVGGAARVNVLYKIAEVADQTAADYTVTQAFSLGWAAIMYRITGWTTGNPFAHGNTAYTAHVQDGSATLTWSGTMTRPAQSVMLMYVCTAGDEDFSFSYSNYASTPSETWTEDGDGAYNMTNYDGGALGVASATTSATTDLTAFQLYKTLDSSDGSETTVMGILPIFTPVSTTGTVARINTTGSFFSNAGLSDATGTVARVNKTATFPGASGKGTTDTVWTARSKNFTTWTARS